MTLQGNPASGEVLPNKLTNKSAAELAGLLERVKAATGPDWKIDYDIFWLLNDWENLGGGWVQHKITGERQNDTSGPLSPVTASIDAALALVERVLPGCGYFILRGEDEAGNTAGLYYRGNGRHASPEREWEESAATPALAILAALLTALKGHSPHD